MRKGRRYLTITYICSRCKWEVTVRTAVPLGKEKYAITYNQGIGPEMCFRCRQRLSLEQAP